MIVAERLDERLLVKKASSLILDSMRNSEMNFCNLYAYEKEIEAIPYSLYSSLFPSDDYERVSYSYSGSRSKYVKYDKDRKELLIQWTDFSNKLKETKISLFNLIYNIICDIDKKVDKNFLDRLRRLAE